MGAVEIRQPRVSDVPEGTEPFRSEIVSRWERRSRTQGRLLARLYLEGLASGDFEPVFRALVGATEGLSPNTILRLKQEWEDEYRLWRGRPLSERYVYVFADGLYLKAGQEREKTAVLVVIGVRADGQKELLAMEEGYRESTVSGPRCCEGCVTVAWSSRRSWRWVTAPWGSGRPSTMSIRAPGTSVAGTTAP
jgi:putative transposase